MAKLLFFINYLFIGGFLFRNGYGRTLNVNLWSRVDVCDDTHVVGMYTCLCVSLCVRFILLKYVAPWATTY